MGEDPVDAVMVPLLELAPEQWEQAVERACREHPGLAAALRERWRVLCEMGLAGPAPAPGGPDGFPERLGDFRLLERLGAGGMGVVYRARQESLERDVALKLMRPEGLYFPAARERFRREIEAVARLEHPGIVPVYSVGEERGVPYFAMQLLDGPTLAEVLARLAGRAPEQLSGADLAEAVGASSEGGARGAVPAGGVFALSWIDACTELARQVADALEHAHARGLVHRDVKPSNVVLTRDGRAQLFDFGLAMTSQVDRLTRSGGQLGTLQYMAPEQLGGEREIDARADVYALGATLYELLCLSPAFGGASRSAVEASVRAGRPEPLRSRNRRVPSELELVCAKAMELDRARRYPSAGELRDDLRRLLERRPVLARPAGLPLRARRWVQRHPALAVAALAAVGLFGVAPSVLLWREQQSSRALAASLQKETAALAAERTARAAEGEALEEARDSFAFLERMLAEADPWSSGNPDARVRDLLERGREALEAFEGSESLRARLAVSLAAIHSAHALFPEALELGQLALEAERALGEPIEAGRDRPIEVVTYALAVLGRDAEALPLLEEALQVEQDPELRARLEFAAGKSLVDLGRVEQGVERLERARAAFEGDSDERRALRLTACLRLAGALSQLGRHEPALAAAEEALELADRRYDPEHPAQAHALVRTAFPLLALGETGEALARAREAVDIAQAFYGAEHFALVYFLSELANLLGQAEEFEQAAEAGERLVALQESLCGPADPRTEQARRLLSAYRARARSAR